MSVLLNCRLFFLIKITHDDGDCLKGEKPLIKFLFKFCTQNGGALMVFLYLGKLRDLV